MSFGYALGYTYVINNEDVSHAQGVAGKCVFSEMGPIKCCTFHSLRLCTRTLMRDSSYFLHDGLFSDKFPNPLKFKKMQFVIDYLSPKPSFNGSVNEII